MKNEIFKSEVIDYTHDGQAVVKYDDKPIFVKNGVVGEEVEVEITKMNKKYGFGKIINYVSSSSQRAEYSCPYFNQCGGCQIQHLCDDEQATFKQNKIINAYHKYAHLDVKIDDFIEASEVGYRNKLSLPLAINSKKETYAGLYRLNSNEIIRIDKCLIQNDMINDVMDSLVKLINENNISIYSKKSHKGLLRHLVFRYSKQNNELLIGFVINDRRYLNQFEHITNEIVKQYDCIKSVVVNFNYKHDNVILGRKTIPIYGQHYIMDKINDYTFQISLNSFFQVNTYQTSKLINKAIEMANLNENDIVLDAYCGVGSIGINFANSVKKVIGVDNVQEAINDAKLNKSINQIKNIEFECMDVQEYMVTNKNKFSAVVLDPPRKGCSIEFLNAIVDVKPKKIVYISCDVSTQARDVSFLLEQGYVLKNVVGVDMFKHTYHVETIALLERK